MSHLRRPAGLLLSLSCLLSLTLGCSQSQTTSTSKPAAAGSGNCFLDSQKRGASTVRLDGWAVGAEQDPPQSIAVRLEGGSPDVVQRTTKLLSRSDVADFFKNPKLNKTGFSIEVPSADFPPGSRVAIISEGAAGDSVCKTQFTLK